jgi:hypothetical protein
MTEAETLALWFVVRWLGDPVMRPKYVAGPFETEAEARMTAQRETDPNAPVTIVQSVPQVVAN